MSAPDLPVVCPQCRHRLVAGECDVHGPADVELARRADDEAAEFWTSDERDSE